MCTGGMTSRYPRAEADACREVVESQGVPASAVIMEAESRSTEENAINARRIMDEHGWQDAVLVSDSYHLLRARWIFSLEGITVYRSPIPPAQTPLDFYLFSVAREIVALHWQVVKLALNLPQTYVGGL